MKKLVFFISFFIYSGYYAGLAFVFLLRLDYLSRYYSIPLRIVLSAVMTYVIIKNWTNLVAHKFSPYIFLFSLFWIFYCLKVLHSQNISNGNDLSKAWFEFIFFALTYVVLPFFTFLSLNFKTYKNTILDSMIFSGFVMGAISTYLYGYLLISGVGRISLITYETGESVLSPLALSYGGALTIVLCIHRLVFLREKSRFIKLYLFSTIILSFIMFLLGSSRGWVMALLLTLPLFVLYSPFKQKIKLTLLMILSIPLVIWAIEASGSNIFERIGSTSKDKGSGRNVLWERAITHFLDNPIFGGRVEIGGIYPHNLIIEIFMATGILGAFLILSVIFKGFKVSFINAKNDKQNLFVSLIMVQAFIQYLFSSGIYTSTLLFVPIALAFNIANNTQEIKKF